MSQHNTMHDQGQGQQDTTAFDGTAERPAEDALKYLRVLLGRRVGGEACAGCERGVWWGHDSPPSGYNVLIWSARMDNSKSPGLGCFLSC